jgi:hypothetical protein
MFVDFLEFIEIDKISWRVFVDLDRRVNRIDSIFIFIEKELAKWLGVPSVSQSGGSFKEINFEWESLFDPDVGRGVMVGHWHG